MKPIEYHVPYTVLRETRYTCKEPEGKGVLPKMGWLQPGRVVWLQHEPTLKEDSMPGFTEGIGVVDLDTTLLQRV